VLKKCDKNREYIKCYINFHNVEEINDFYINTYMKQYYNYQQQAEDQILEVYQTIKSSSGINKALKDKTYKRYKRGTKTGYITCKFNLTKIYQVLKKHNLPYETQKHNKRPDNISQKDYAYAYRWAQLIWAYKLGGGKCVICGHSDPRHLVYHHKDPSTKSGSIAHMIKDVCKKEEIIAEINKCELLCMHCHRDKHIQSDRLVMLSDTIRHLATKF